MKLFKQVIKNFSFFFLMFVTFTSCVNKIDENKKKSYNNLPLYRIKNFPLTSIPTNWSVDLNISHINDSSSVLGEFNYMTNEFRIVDLYKDEIVKIIKIPEKINKIGSISMFSRNIFAFLTDTTFFVFKNNSLKRFDYKIFMDDYIPLNYINIIFKPKENKIISGVLTYKKRKKYEKDYSSFFLNVYDLNKMTSSIIPFSYPKQFHGYRLGIPIVYLSESNNDLLVSFALDDNIYKINLKTNKVDTISCKSEISSIQDASFPVKGDKQSKMDAIQKNGLNVGGYGKAFFDKNRKKIYRIFRPALPLKDRNGNYYSSQDIGAHILVLDLSNNTIKEIQLANGQYYVPNDWSFNPYKNCLIYPKLDQHVNKENLCFYNIHSISAYNE